MMSQMNWFKQGDHCATFVCIGTHSWLYIGDCVCVPPVQMVYTCDSREAQRIWPSRASLHGLGPIARRDEEDVGD